MRIVTGLTRDDIELRAMQAHDRDRTPGSRYWHELSESEQSLYRRLVTAEAERDTVRAIVGEIALPAESEIDWLEDDDLEDLEVSVGWIRRARAVALRSDITVPA